MFNQSSMQLRDSAIVKLTADKEMKLNSEPTDIVSYLADQEMEIANPAGNREVNGPMILLEGDRESLGTSAYYIYPPHTGNAIPFALYFQKWAGFARLVLSEKVIQGMNQADYAFELLKRAVSHCRQTNGITEARKLTQALHDARWSIGPEMSASLFTIATIQDQPDTKSRLPLSTDREFIDNEIVELRKLLKAAKYSSKNLTEWCESLYSINPRVWAILSYLRDSSFPDTEKWYRYFAEVDADIAPCSMRDVFSVIRSEKGEHVPSWMSLFLEERESSNNHSEFKQKLQYLLHSRTTIPKYWYELALVSYDTPQEQLPVELDSIDKWRAVSVDCLRASSVRWLNNRSKST